MLAACFTRLKYIFLQKSSKDINYYISIKKQLRPGWEAFKIILIYCMLGIIWIAFPDMLLSGAFDNMLDLHKISIFKGWAFVGLSSIIIFAFIYS